MDFPAKSFPGAFGGIMWVSCHVLWSGSFSSTQISRKKALPLGRKSVLDTGIPSFPGWGKEYFDVFYGDLGGEFSDPYDLVNPPKGSGFLGLGNGTPKKSQGKSRLVKYCIQFWSDTVTTYGLVKIRANLQQPIDDDVQPFTLQISFRIQVIANQ